MNPLQIITLDEQRIKLFSETYYLRYRVSFQTKDANLNPAPIVAIRPSNWIKLSTYGSVKYEINGD